MSRDKTTCAVSDCDGPRLPGRARCRLHRRQMLAQQRRRQRERWPDRRSAWSAVERAVRRGELPHPETLTCAGCGSASAAHYDHVAGYAPEARLHVEPVCVSCHAARRRVRGEVRGGSRRPDAPVPRDLGVAQAAQDAIRDARIEYLRSDERRPRRAARLATLGVVA